MNYKRALEILEIRPPLELNIDVVKRKYRMLALLYHPDKNPASDAQEQFQNIHSAYEFLISYLNSHLPHSYGYVRSSSSHDEYNPDIETDMFSQSYKNILIQFLRGIIESEYISEAWKNRDEINSIFYSVIHKITEKCEEKSLEILGNLNKDLLIKTYDILYKYSSVFRISDEFVLKVQKMVEDLLKNDECIILNPTLEDLFEKNIYKLIIIFKSPTFIF